MRYRLRRERQLAGYSQATIARMVGVSQQSVAKWELERTTPSHFAQIRKCEDILGVPAEVLFPDIFN